MVLRWCDITKFIMIVIGIMFLLGLCRKWSNDYEEEFFPYNNIYKSQAGQIKLFPDSDKSFFCSKNCCATEWRSDMNIVNDGVDPEKYQASNLNCNDGVQDTGCICLPKL